MTQDTATPTQQPQGLAVAETRAISETNVIARDIASRLKFMIVNGSKLADAEVWALSQFAAATGLNPFGNECYYMPGKGPVPGIGGWRRRAQEQLEYEVKNFGIAVSPFYLTEFVFPSHDEVNFDQTKGDIAYKCILTDSVSEKQWHQNLFGYMGELRGSGTADYFAIAKELAGPKPSWVGFGVVYAYEDFGKTEKFERHERARKRAEAMAIKKRFPRIDLPAPDEVSESPYRVVQNERPKQTRTKSELLNGMGFEAGDEKTPAPSTTPAPEEPPTEGEFTDATSGRPMQPDALRSYIADETKKLKGAKNTSDQMRSVCGCLDYLCQGEGARLEFLGNLVQKPITSTKDLPPEMVVALFRYLKPYYDENATVYLPAADVQRYVSQEVTTAHAAWLKENGQGTLFN